MSLNKSIKCLKVSAVAVFMLLFQFANAQYDFKALNKLVVSSAKEFGGSIAVVVYSKKDGKVVYKKDTGDLRVNEQIPIASCSKWLTAAVVMTLVDEGKINLDEKIFTYIPIFQQYGKTCVTVRNCLTHQTGIHQENVSIKSILNRKKYEKLEDEIDDIASKEEIDFACNSNFFYGSVGLDIAARICEVVTKKSFQQLVTERISRAMSMRQTTFQSEDFEHITSPSGGARSSALDYANFLAMLLNKGEFMGKKVLTEASVLEMEKQQINADGIKYMPVVAAGYNYGFGNWIMQADGFKNGVVVSCPGMFGSFPIIDFCRGYGLVIFAKSLINENRRGVAMAIKHECDKIFIENNKCFIDPE